MSSAIIAVKEKSFKISKVRKICDDYKLYYYCKKNHTDMTTTTYLNKSIALQLSQFLDIKDN